MISRKLLIIAGAVILVTSGAALIFFTMQNDEVSIGGVEKTQSTAKRVEMKNLNAYMNRIGEEYQGDMTTMLYEYLKLSGANLKATPTGVIRDGSYQTKTNEFGEATSFLVDFPDIKYTYKVIYSNDKSGYKAVNIICPSADEMIYDEVECKDSVSG